VDIVIGGLMLFELIDFLIVLLDDIHRDPVIETNDLHNLKTDVPLSE
jgi:hypothetical protein